jgi:restriction system protein
LPLLQYSSDGKLHSTKEAHDAMVDHFRLSQEDQQEMLPSGKQATYKNRVAWARVYLSKALLLEAPKRGFFRITERGQELTEIQSSRTSGKAFETVSRIRRISQNR